MVGAYNVSKAADFQLARNYAVEYGPRGVRFTLDTAWTASIRDVGFGVLFALLLVACDPERRQGYEPAFVDRPAIPADPGGLGGLMDSPARAFLRLAT